MSLWTLEPRDPLVVRDGRPNHGRSESAMLPFPYPGTIAGILRTRLGSDAEGVFDPEQDLPSLLRVAMRGPLLARADGSRLYVAPPRDAVVFGTVPRRLIPQGALPAGALVDEAFHGEPVRFASGFERVPGKAPPPLSWWPWELMERWLAAPETLDGKDAKDLIGLGLHELPDERRAHVKVADTWTAEDGMLFQTRGLRFTTEAREALALVIDVDEPSAGARALRPGIAPSGGERRLLRWQPAPPALALPVLSDELRAALTEEVPSVRVRVVLLTPAIFKEGWKPGAEPGQLLGSRAGFTPTLAAACVPRPETISGWDFAKRAPKKTRRLVRAGSVYWLDLPGAPADRLRWAEELMMTNVSDAPQDRRDGFGLVALGVGS
jgi:CRISPR-associated protein Cmr3